MNIKPIFIGAAASLLGIAISEPSVAGPPRSPHDGYSYLLVSHVSFGAGDHVTIAHAGTKLMRGHDVLATLNEGQEVSVLEVQGQWIGTSVEIDGQVKSGWVATRNVVSIEKAPAPASETGDSATSKGSTTPCQQTTYRPIVASDGSACSEQVGSLNSSWRDPFGLREYNPTITLVPAHEWDPNIHEWKPWQLR